LSPEELSGDQRSMQARALDAVKSSPILYTHTNTTASLLMKDRAMSPKKKAFVDVRRSLHACRACKSMLLVCAVTLTLSTALAQAPPPGPPRFSPIPAPDQSQALALATLPGTSAQNEQWESFYDDETVRNVTVPTLTPVLPDPAKMTGAAIIVAPGGGFMYLSMKQEGDRVARWLADHGIAAFVLKYRTRETPRDPSAFQADLNSMLGRAAGPSHEVPETPADAVEDAKAAIKLVRAKATAWHVDPTRIGFVGFSAGAILTLAVGLTEDAAARPNFIAPIYGPMDARSVPADAPPMFVALALDDPVMAQNRSLDLIQSWRTAGRPIEAHLYEHGGHGFGLRGYKPASALWIEEFYAWMADCGLLKPRA
jgi:acetyl esterase/lipase